MSVELVHDSKAFIDDCGNIVIVGLDNYRKVSWVDDGITIPDSWKKLIPNNIVIKELR